MSLLISCVMPTKNRARFVPTAIRCFLRQTHPAKELLIVDDGTESILHLIPDDSRIRYIRTRENTPTGTKRNLGAALSSGDLIANWDDDDFSHPHRLEAPKAGLVCFTAES